MAKGRRRWTVRLVLLGALVWLLGWQGLGWLSGPGAEGATTGEEGTDVARGAEGDGGSQGTASGGGAEPPADDARVEEPRVPTGAGSGGDSEDHVQALLRVPRQAVETGMLGGGFQALDELDGLPIGAARRAESAQVRTLLLEHLDDGMAALREDVRRGRLLAARQRCGDLLRIPHAAVAQALAGLVRSEDWPVLRGGEPPPGYLPEPRPLPAERFVRFYRTGVEVRARVVDCTPVEVTVRLVDDRGVTFPSLALTQVELPDATAAEAAEMGLAALHVGDVLLARLWLCHGLSLGGGPRCKELAGLLG